MPKQSILAMKVAFGLRAKYAAFILIMSTVVLQVLGVIIFAGKVTAVGTVSYSTSIPVEPLHTPFPVAVAIDSSDNTYVAVNNIVSGDVSVVKSDSSGNFIDRIGSAGTGDGQFSDINGIAIDSGNNIYVLDANRVQKFNSSGSYVLKWGSAGSGSGQFNNAEALAVDSSDNVYVVDRNNSRIEKFNSSGTYITEWGSGDLDHPTGIAINSSDVIYVFDSYNDQVKSYSTSGVAGLAWGSNGTGAGEFDGTTGADLAIDGNDNIHVVEWDNGRIQQFDSTGNYVFEYGGNSGTVSSCVEGLFSNASNHGGASDIAINSSNQIYVSDYGASNVQIFDDTGLYMNQLGKRAPGQVYGPSDMATDSNGNMFVFDRGNSRIQKFNASGTYVAKWGEYGSGGSGELGMTSEDCWNVQIGQAPKAYLAVGPSGKVYVIDKGNGNSRVIVYDNDGTYYTEWSLGGGYSWGIAVDGDENVYIAGAGEVRKNDANGNPLTSWSTELPTGGAFNYRYVGIATGPGNTVYVAVNSKVLTYSSTGTALNSFTLSNYSSQPAVRTIPHIAVDGLGNIFVTDNSNVQKLAPDGQLITYWGSAGDGDGQFGTPGGVAVDPFGKVYVSNLGTSTGALDKRIQVFNDASFDLRLVTNGSQSVTSVSATLNMGTNDVASSSTPDYTFEYGPTTSYGSTSSSVSTSISRTGSTSQVSSSGWTGTLGSFWKRDSQGNTYITASDCRVLKFDSSGNYVLQIGGSCLVNSTTDLGYGTGPMAFDSSDHLFVTDTSDSQYILEFDTDGSYLGYIDAGQANIKAIAIDTQDNLYVGLGVSGHQVLKFDSSGTQVAQWGSTGTGDGEFSGDAFSISLDASNNVYTLEGGFGQERVQKFTTNGGFITKWSVAANSQDSMVAGNVLYTYDYGQVVMYSLNGASLSSFTYVNPDYYGLESANTAIGEVYLKGPAGAIATYHRAGAKNITGLTCGSIYHYRVAALAHGDTVYGDDETFTTSDCLTITTTTLPNGVVDASYDQTIGSNRSGMDYTVTAGSLPGGLTLDTSGQITGTPTTVGTYNFTVQAEDGATSETDTQALQIEVTAAPPDPFVITTTSLPGGKVGVAYSQTIATDSPNPIACSKQSGSLPTSLSLSSSGVLSGTPTVAGTYAFTVLASDGTNTDTQAYSVTIAPADVVVPVDPPVDPVDPPTDPVDPPVEPTDPPTITDVTPPATTSTPTPEPDNVFAAKQTLVTTQNSLFALAKGIPEPFAIGFPWLLLILALILVSIQYYQVHAEAVATKRLQTSVANQERLVDEQNNFVALSTHYLHTPLSVMEGEISLMVKAGTLTQAQATKLTATLASLNAEAEATLAEEEQDELNA